MKVDLCVISVGVELNAMAPQYPSQGKYID